MSQHVRRNRPRARTEQQRHLTVLVEREATAADDDVATHADRPRTRRECVDGPRPCAFISCRHHLAIDVDPDNGSIKINHPDGEPWGIADTCSLDVADRGEVTTHEVGRLLNISRARVDQIIAMATRAIAKTGRLQ